MIVLMQAQVGKDDARTQEVVRVAEELGLQVEVTTISGTIAEITEVHLKDGETVPACSVPGHVFRQLKGVDRVNRVTPSRISLVANGDFAHHYVEIGSVKIGKGLPCRLIAGSCTVDRHIDDLVARLVHKHGITRIRGGCWKPRSDALSFPGFGERAVNWFLKAAQLNGVESVFIEVMDSRHISVIREIRGKVGYRGQIVLWVGARTHNPDLMQVLGRQLEFPVMIKNPIRMTRIGEWIGQAERVAAGERHFDDSGSLIPEQSLSQGNDRILLCSRGVQEDDPDSIYRFAPRHHVISAIHKRYWPPVGVDPNHSAGTMEDDLVLTNLEAALIHKPDFVMLEVYFDDDDDRKALCDARQAVPLSRLHEVQKMLAGHNRKHFGTRAW